MAPTTIYNHILEGTIQSSEHFTLNECFQFANQRYVTTKVEIFGRLVLFQMPIFKSKNHFG